MMRESVKQRDCEGARVDPSQVLCPGVTPIGLPRVPCADRWVRSNVQP